MKHLPILVLLLSNFLALGQTDSTDVDPLEMSLEQLMNIKVTASKTNLSSRETPSIVSVITREDIKNMGARDLMDVLNQVPGFSFGADVQNIVGIGSRGNWGHEGKVLLLMDGNEMNEILYATTQFGQHYNISNIDRIEIIRGPGSSIYGGYAELGVINIITRNGQQMKEASAGVMYGGVSGGTARQNIRFNIGNGDDKLNYSLSALYGGNGIRSSKTYTDIYGNQTDMSKTSLLRPMMFNGNINAGEFSLSMIYDGYNVSTADQYDQIALTPSGGVDKLQFNTFYTSMKYNAKVGSKITITPKINFKIGTPWKTVDNSPFPYAVRATRFAPGVNASINPSDKINLVLGVDSYFDNATSINDPLHFNSISAGKTVSFYNTGAFVQGVFKTPFANFTLGGRVDNHSQFGSAFSPRLGITKAWPSFHIKALYSRAFRSPAIENINTNRDIKPERTGVAEIEFGYKINDNMFVTVNGFQIVISDPIVFYVDSSHPAGTYGNFDVAGSTGFEIDYRIKYGWGYVSANYSYYTAQNVNKVTYYYSGYNDKSVLSLPSGKFNMLANVKLTDIFSINPSVNILSKRYEVTSQDASNNYIYSEIKSQVIANLFLRAKTSGFDAGVGVYNLTDENQVYIQAYSGGHAPLPGLGREFMINVIYTMPFK